MRWFCQKFCRDKLQISAKFCGISHYDERIVWIILHCKPACISIRGYREESSSIGQTNQPQPATYSSPHPGGDDLLPTNRRGFPLQAQGTRGGRQEDSGGAPKLSDSMFVWNQVNVYELVQLHSSTVHGWKRKVLANPPLHGYMLCFWSICFSVLTMFERTSVW